MLGFYKLKTLLIVLSTSWLLLLGAAAKAETLKLVSTIKPIALIVKEIAGSSAESRVLLPPTASPHHFQLKPSDLRHLYQADMVFWVGPGLEAFLDQTLGNLPEAVETVALMEHVNVEEGDAHIWMNPLLVIQVAEAITDKLVAKDRENADIFHQNLEIFKNKLKALDEELVNQFALLKGQGYILQHESLGYFEARYKLQHLTVLNPGAEHQGSVKNLVAVTELLESGAVNCVLLEPQFSPKQAEILNVSKYSHTFHFDPLFGHSESYIQSMRQFGVGFASCLQ